MYRLYKLSKKDAKEIDDASTIDEYTVVLFKPNPFKIRIKGERLTDGFLQIYLVRVIYWLISYGKATLVYLQSENGDVAHHSYVIPKCFKFRFLKKDDFEIGPCFTYEEYRGQGLYGKVLNYIAIAFGNDKSDFYILVREANKESIAGVEKTIFKLDGYADKTKKLKIYQRVEE